MRPLPALILLSIACQGGQTEDSAKPAAPPDDSGGPGCTVEPAPPPAGCVVTLYEDEDGDGREPVITRTRHDGLGRPVSMDSRNPEDWEDFILCGTTWFEDSAWPEEEWCLGRANYTYRWSFDGWGFPDRKVYDASSDGTPDKSWEFSTDEQGNILEEAQDQDLDGTADSFLRNAWDEAGHKIEERWDYTADGADDYVRAWVYDEDGRLIEESTDSDGDGTIDEQRTHTVDPAGRRLSSSIDEDGDGVEDGTEAWLWEDCRLGEIQATGGGLTVRTTYEWTEEGWPLRVEEDNNGDGRSDAASWYEYACP